MDGKFIFTNVGTGTGVAVTNIRIKNGQAYYVYSKTLGAPTLSYFGMIDNTVRNEYWIPINKNVHTHIPDHGVNGVSIATDSGKSSADRRAANLLQRNYHGMFLFVIEAKDDGKYLTASYTYDITTYLILGNDLILADICNTVN